MKDQFIKRSAHVIMFRFAQEDGFPDEKVLGDRAERLPFRREDHPKDANDREPCFCDFLSPSWTSANSPEQGTKGQLTCTRSSVQDLPDVTVQAQPLDVCERAQCQYVFLHLLLEAFLFQDRNSRLDVAVETCHSRRRFVVRSAEELHHVPSVGD